MSETQEFRERFKKALLDILHEEVRSEGVSIEHFERVASPFDNTKNKFFSFDFDGKLRLMIGYDFQKYWLFIKEAPSYLSFEDFLNTEVRGTTFDVEKAFSSSTFADLENVLVAIARRYTFPSRSKSIVRKHLKLSTGERMPKKAAGIDGIWFSITTRQGFKFLFARREGFFYLIYAATPPRFPVERYQTATIGGYPAFAYESLEGVEEVLRVVARDASLWRKDRWREAYGRNNTIRSALARRQPKRLVVPVAVMSFAIPLLGILHHADGWDGRFSISLVLLIMAFLNQMPVWTEQERYTSYHPLVDRKRHVFFTPLANFVLFLMVAAGALALLAGMFFI